MDILISIVKRLSLNTKLASNLMPNAKPGQQNNNNWQQVTQCPMNSSNVTLIADPTNQQTTTLITCVELNVLEPLNKCNKLQPRTY